MLRSLVGSEMCIRDRVSTQSTGHFTHNGPRTMNATGTGRPRSRPPPAAFRDRCIQTIAEWWVLPVIQTVFGCVVTPTKLLWNRLEHTAQDQHELMHNVRVTKGVRYGRQPSEVYELMEPASGPLLGVVFYVHGGGFVCTSAELYDASVAYLARNGLVVVMVDYPLAPQARHPAPLVSVLSAIAHLISSRPDLDDCPLGTTLFGDSAGANLAMLAGAVLSNPEIRLWLEQQSGTKIHAMVPRLHRVISMYGMLGQEVLPTGPALARHALQILWRAHDIGDCGFPAQFADLLDSPLVREYPQTLLCLAEEDDIKNSSVVVAAKMKMLGLQNELRRYPGLHGFFGLPCAWSLGRCHSNAMPCAEYVLNFLVGQTKSSFNSSSQVPLRDVNFEWSALVVFFEMLILIPLACTGFPVLVLMQLTSGWRQRRRQLLLVAWILAGTTGGGLACFVRDAWKGLLSTQLCWKKATVARCLRNRDDVVDIDNTQA
eukprot:TRINITY_DN59939_c0_g1_i1.p1 TRINITY_DN59939_c0_g1~~TRINITY_DN59939_c0_g1_i1.p1  ORF type:complete len:486 (-),score=48.63 TRINITY_DN59939_c0_g1_i1:80-1537(-)